MTMLTFYDKAILIENYNFSLNKSMNPQLMFLKFNIKKSDRIAKVL